MNKTFRNILRAAVVGIATGMILGGLLSISGLHLPGYISTIGIGLVIALAYLWLNNHTR